MWCGQRAASLTRQVEEQTGKVFPVPDFSIEHWGVYEARRLAQVPPEQFRLFVLRAFGAIPEEYDAGIHGCKGAIPVWVGEPDQKKAVTAQNVQDFPNAIRRTLRYKQDNLRDGIMLAWTFRPDAVEAAERLRRLEQTDLNFIRLDMIRIDSPRFREHVTALSTDHADYENFLTFVQPPKVEVQEHAWISFVWGSNKQPELQAVVRQNCMCLKLIDFALRPSDIHLHAQVPLFDLSFSCLPCEYQGIDAGESCPAAATGSDEAAMSTTPAARG
jgi:hypothetical protein